MKRQVGVDIGTSEVRVVEVRGLDSKGNAIISRIGRVPLKTDALVRGRIQNHMLVSQAVIRALREAGVSNYGFVVGLSSPDVAVGRTTLPAAVKSHERAKTLRANGIDLGARVTSSNAAIATNLVETRKTGEGMLISEVSVAAADHAALADLMKTMKLARCQPRAVDLSGAAVMRALVRTKPDARETHTVVDIGGGTTTVATRQGLHLRSVRVLDVGAEALGRSIMGATGEDLPAAMERLRYLTLGSGVPGPVSLESSYGVVDDDQVVSNEQRLENAVEEALSIAAEDLIERIASSIEADARGGPYTQGVVLCGGGAQLSGLKERLHQRVGVPVQVSRPWAVIERSKRNVAYYRDGVEDPRLMVALTTAVGLALWRQQP